MRAPFALGLAALTLPLALSTVACSRDDSIDAGEDNVSVAPREPLVVGAYGLDATEREGALTILSATPTTAKFSVSIVNLFGGHNMGDLTEVDATLQGGKWVHTSEDCKIILTPSPGAVGIEQEGGCQFGFNVRADGKFTLFPAPKAGKYVLEATERQGTLEITETSPGSATFSVSIVNLFGGHNMGDLEQAKAEFWGKDFIYAGIDDDCRMTLKPVGEKIELAQEGTCQFGFNVRADGVYRPE